MHVHASQLNPNAALDAAYAAQKAAANREAAATRKKLLDFASALAGETDSYVARTGDEEEPSRGNPQHSDSGGKERRRKNSAQADAEETRSHLSNWA